MPFTKITIAGAGTMGSQVAWQMAFHGKHVTVYDAIPAGLDKGEAFQVVHHVARLIREATPGHPALESARFIDEEYIQQGHLGWARGQGFYSYPKPTYSQPGFI